MDIRDKVPVIRVAIRGANGRMGLQAIYASMENNEDILVRAKRKELTDKDVWIDIVFGAFTADIPTVQQLLAGVMRSEKSKILEGYDKSGSPIYRLKADGKHELRTKYLEQTLDEEPQRDHVIPFDRQEIVDTPEGIPAIKILSHDKQEVLSIIRHINVRLGELSGEAIMDRVLDTAYDLGANVLLSCVGDTAKKADPMKRWMDKIHEKGYSIGFLESAPAKGWESRMLSRQDEVTVMCSRNFSPTGTLFRTGLALKNPLFEYKDFEFGKASAKFRTVLRKIIEQIISTDEYSYYAQILEKQPKTIREIDGEKVLVNFPPNFLTINSPNYLTFSFYEDNEYGFIYASLIPNLKGLSMMFRDRELVDQIRREGVSYEAVTNVPGLFGIDWFSQAPAEIIRRGGALSTSSCTTNGNLIGDFLMIMALYCYYDFFLDTVHEYCLSSEKSECAKIEEKIEKKLSEFKGYLEDLMSRRSNLIRTVFNFYYDNITFINTDMQHGLTRSESPDVIDYLRETSSGSQTEVPKLLSLPDREVAYLKGLAQATAELASRESDDKEKENLSKQLNTIEASIKTIEDNIKIINILEEIEAK
ncbi:MAG TPA: hypothetical protein ENN05_00160 [Deltaproteobacteria bacterium]|nr:hypothetical protein [Deltaproteobacteria bacterium]